LLVATLLALSLPCTRAGGQASGARVSYEAGAMGIFALTHATPAMFGKDATDLYLTQPNVMGSVRRGPFRLLGTLNFEGYTLKRGELNAGIYGEGYIDRRHPHTLVHEVMLTATSPALGGLRGSLAGGKGFTPFGTDDPMVRPFVKYPVNHHHAQVIERVQVIGALAYGDSARGVALEHAFFNGDEPVTPFTAPQWRRVGDSRSTRLTVTPHRHLELQASRAFVRSPGITQGGAYDHTQTSASLRFNRVREGRPTGAMAAHDMRGHDGHGEQRYLLIEVARTDEGFNDERAFRYNSVLAEGLVTHRGWALGLRAERTDRPESQRLLDPFRIPSGHIDFQINGITRWQIGTVHMASPALTLPGLNVARVTPLFEVALARPEPRHTPSVFVPREFYGAGNLWSFTFGIRMHVGTMRTRMGRYGVLAHDP
jgi:hypothetical protein